MSGQPWLFKWRHFEAEIIVCAVRWYLRYSLSYREVQELMAERGSDVDHSTIWRWVKRYAPELALRQRAHLKPTNKSWRVDKTYVRVKGEWCYLYRVVDSEGATVEFFLSAFRDKESAQSLFRRALVTALLHHASSIPISLPLTRQRSEGCSARATCRAVVGTGPFSTSITSWSKITVL